MQGGRKPAAGKKQACRRKRILRQARYLSDIHIHRLGNTVDGPLAGVLPDIIMIGEAQCVPVLGDPDAVFADVGVSMIAVLNALRILKKDKKNQVIQNV